jgi:AraC-like DNA-binding protein
MVGECADSTKHTNIPLYADGYPGIMFQQSENGCYLLPRNKKLSELFLYGQTLKPVALDIFGRHQYIVVQLYPFASNYLLDVDPKELNDDCYDLLQIKFPDVSTFNKQLIAATTNEARVKIISNLIRTLIKTHKISENNKIEQAIGIIIQEEGQITIKDLLSKIFMTERTLERQFQSHVGLTPKQFAKIIQFKSSISKLTQQHYNSLLEVGLDCGFSDQSHFIRTFKAYTGQTPSYYLNQMKP